MTIMGPFAEHNLVYPRRLAKPQQVLGKTLNHKFWDRYLVLI